MGRRARVVTACLRERERRVLEHAAPGFCFFVKAALLDGPCRLAAAPQNRASGSARTGRSLPRGEAAVRPCSIPAWLSAAFTRKQWWPESDGPLATDSHRAIQLAREAACGARTSTRPSLT